MSLMPLLLKTSVSLLKQENGVVCIMAGHLEPGYKKGANAKATTKSQGDIWEHNEDTSKELWKSLGDEMGTKWDVKAWLWRFGLHSELEKRSGFERRNMELLCLLLQGCRYMALHLF